MKNKLIFVLIAMLLLKGMSSVKELNDLAIVSAIGIDINEKGEYIVTSQILNSKKENSSGSGTSSSDNSSDTVIYTSTSTSVQNAIKNMVEESPKKLYLAHLELVLLSEKIARKENLLNTLDYFIRDNEANNNFVIAITKNETPQKILEILTPLEKSPANNIKDSIIATNKYKGISQDKTLSKNVKMLLEKGNSGAITSIKLDNSSKDNKEDINKKDPSNVLNSDEIENKTYNDKKIKIEPLGYFKDKKLKGYLDNDESFIYNLLHKNIDTGIIRVGKDDNLLVTEMVRYYIVIKPVTYENKLYMDIDLNCTCIVGEIGKNVKIETKEQVMDIENILEDRIKSNIEDFINKCKYEYNVDLVGFEEKYHKFKNKEYKKLKNKYKDDTFKMIIPRVNVKVKIPNEGGTFNIW